MKFLILAISLLLSSIAGAESFTEIYQKGSGNKYDLHLENIGTADVSLYVADVEDNILSVEMYFINQGLLTTEMWQYFELEKKARGPLSVKKGIFFVKELDNPEILPPERLKGEDDVFLADFLIELNEDIEKDKVNEETIQVPAGKVKAIHYKKSYPKKDIEYWISSSVKPFGLVKLISKSKEKGDSKDNYVMNLKSLLKNVKSKIDTSKAKPLSEKGKKLLDGKSE